MSGYKVNIVYCIGQTFQISLKDVARLIATHRTEHNKEQECSPEWDSCWEKEYYTALNDTESCLEWIEDQTSFKDLEPYLSEVKEQYPEEKGPVLKTYIVK